MVRATILSSPTEIKLYAQFAVRKSAQIANLFFRYFERTLTKRVALRSVQPEANWNSISKGLSRLERICNAFLRLPLAA